MEKETSYGSSGVPRRVIGILYLVVPLVVLTLHWVNVTELKDYDSILIAIGAGFALLGIGTIKDMVTLRQK